MPVSQYPEIAPPSIVVCASYPGANAHTEWHDWFAAMDRPAPTGPGFFLNNYLISLQAAEDHVGAVLGCTMMFCDTPQEPKCLEYKKD